MNNPYEDIINLPHHTSGNRKPMSMEARAAQFAPFAALTGHDAALAETARHTASQFDQPTPDLLQLNNEYCKWDSLSTSPTVPEENQ